MTDGALGTRRAMVKYRRKRSFRREFQGIPERHYEVEQSYPLSAESRSKPARPDK